MAEILSVLKRKTRPSSSSSESDPRTPKEKRVCEDTELKEDNEDEDEISIALDMSKEIAAQLCLVLQKLDSMEKKLEGVLEKVNGLERTVSGVQTDVVSLRNRTTTIETSTKEMEDGMQFMNSEVEALKEKLKQNEQEMKILTDNLLYQEVYNRKENLRFLGVPENEQPGEDTAECIYRFIERELEIENARDIEFQRIHRIGSKKRGLPRPIIARFLKYPDRERVFKRALELKEEIDVKVYVDLPKEIQERRKKLWPRLKRAREDNKIAFFSRKEPDKLYVDGLLVSP